MTCTLAAEDLTICMREYRHQLNLFLRDGDRRHMEAIPALRIDAEALLEKTKRLSRDDSERQLIERVDQGCHRFFDEFTRITAPDFQGDFRAASEHLVEVILENDVLAPNRAYINFNRQVVDGNSRESQDLANRIRLGMVALGVCGALGGLVAGVGLALSLSRSIVQLQVPIRGAAGKLNEVVGPFTVSVGSGLDSLNVVLQQMADQVGTVVERLQAREHELLKGEHLAAVGQLAAGLAHELRNPLMPIKIMVQAASEPGRTGGLQGHDLKVIEEEITRLEQSIQDFLEFARPPLPEKTRCDLRPVVRQTLDLLAARAGRQNVSLREDLPVDAVEIEADRGQIRQILINLVLNALDALPEGGVISIGLAVEAEPQHAASQQAEIHNSGELKRLALLVAQFAVSSTPLPQYVVLRVADNGTGIPPEMLPRVFEPFVSSKETGTGLGLSICERIAIAHGGTITVQNRPGGGAEFICRFPMPEGAPLRSDPRSNSINPAAQPRLPAAAGNFVEP